MLRETVADYWARKNEELALLARAARETPPVVANGAELLRGKQHLRAVLLARALTADPTLTESRLDDREHPRFAYSYQRFDLGVRTRSFFDEVYAVDRRGGPSLGVWGGSGMGIITASLRALDLWLRRPCRLLHASDTYFETLKVLPRLNRLLPNVDDDQLRFGDFFYLDSVTREDHFPLLLRGKLDPLQLILFDTSCYDAASPLIDRVVERCAVERVALLCLRSHLKLDQLASEYARIGSAALWLPPRPSRFHIKLARELRRGIRDELALSGDMPTPTAFFPLAGDPELRSLSARKNARMVEAQARTVEGLRSQLSTVEVIAPHHGCFFFLAPHFWTRFSVGRDVRELVRRLGAAGIETRMAASFGYDVVSITLLHLARGAVLRLAIPDLPDSEVDRLIEIVAGYFATRTL